MSAAYYNEIDPFAAEWLRRLILFGHIAPGDVDERDIRDVSPDDLIGYEQHHFFAGIGVWSYALRQAGWADDRPVATGSCPCQPFSAAGGRSGFADERHLWPAFHHLIQERGFPVVLGEQVASKDGLAWLDLVSADMEGAGYTGGALDLCSAGFGAPHIRQRLNFVWLADAGSIGLRRRSEHRDDAGAASQVPGEVREQRLRVDDSANGTAIGLADTDGESGGARLRDRGSAQDGSTVAARSRSDGGLGDGSSPRLQGGDADGGVRSGDEGGTPQRASASLPLAHSDRNGRDQGRLGVASAGDDGALGDSAADDTREQLCDPGPVNGFWRDADWLLCRNPTGEPSWRAVEPGTFPLAHGVASRMGLLRGYGNAVNAKVTQGFVEAVMECMP